MSIERALTALEQIATALTTLSVAVAVVSRIPAVAESQEAAFDNSGKTAPEAKAPAKRSRPSKEDVAQATGIKVADQDTALVVAKALAGKPQTAAASVETAPEPMDYEVLKRAVLEVGSYSEAGRAGVIALLNEYGVKNAKDISPELREEFHSSVLGILTDLQNAEAGNDDEAFA